MNICMSILYMYMTIYEKKETTYCNTLDLSTKKNVFFFVFLNQMDIYIKKICLNSECEKLMDVYTEKNSC